MNKLADVFAKYKAVVFFDTETTGLDADTCQIIELAAIRIEQTNHSTLRVADSADMFVKLPESAMLRRNYGGDSMLRDCDYLDSLTVYKDRRAYPHKLANAIVEYGLEGKVQNTHRAIDDVAALFEVCKAMDDERADLLEYVNIFGYNPKYGVSGRRLDGVTYSPQRFHNYMQPPIYTLPALVKGART